MEWYAPYEIVFSRPQMVFLIEFLDILRQGEWPPGPSSSYTDFPSKRTKPGAYFEKPADIYIEVSRRLETTGKDGITLLEEVQNGLNDYTLLSSVAKQALNYISLWDFRKRDSYSQWCAGQRRKHKSMTLRK